MVRGTGNSILIAIRNRIMPPATWMDCWDKCIAERMLLPKNRNSSKMISASSNSRITIRVRRSGATPSSTERNIGMFPRGSMVKNKSVAAATISIIQILAKPVINATVAQVSTGRASGSSSSVKSFEMAMNRKPSGISREKLEPLPGDTSTVICEFL